MTVYLCGPINGRTDAECNNWRSEAKRLLGMHATVDPMRRDYRGAEAANAAEIVRLDKADIDDCDTVLAWFDRPSVGTAMEILYAWERFRPVFVVDVSGKPLSPWISYHAEAVFPNLEDAVKRIIR